MTARKGVESVNIVSPGSYVVCDRVGDFDATEGQGLFYRDTRHLSALSLVVNGVRPAVTEYRVRGAWMEARAVAGDGGLEVVRRRSVAGGMQEEILLANRTGERAGVRVELRCAADFEDLFVVRGYVRAGEDRGELVEEVGEGFLDFSYRRGDFRRGTEVRVSGEGIEPCAEPGRILCDLDVEAGGGRRIEVVVNLLQGGERVRRGKPSKLYARVPVLETDWKDLLA